jgi:hypothetical protein
MDQIIAICKEHKMPMFATFLYQNDPETEEDMACTTNQMYEERPIPERFLRLVDIAMPRRVPPLRMRVTNSDGSVEETVVMG